VTGGNPAWVWLALVDEAPADADAVAEVLSGPGVLAAWRRRAKPTRQALRADPRFVDPAGDEAWISWVQPLDGVRLAFDDVAVQQARREVLFGCPPVAVSALLRDASHFEGAITARRGHDARERLRDDPFARIFPARLLHVGPGLVGTMPAPVGPSIERYGSANPWPWDRYPNAL
jgi:hypothetical protein